MVLLCQLLCQKKNLKTNAQQEYAAQNAKRLQAQQALTQHRSLLPPQELFSLRRFHHHKEGRFRQ